MDIRLDSYGPHYVEAILQGGAEWKTLAASGPPYWRPRTHAEVMRKAQSMAGPGLATEYNFVILADDQPVGECSVHGIAHRDRTAQLGIALWRGADRGRGIGSRALDELIEWATVHLGLQRLEGWVVSTNTPSLRMIATKGFRYEGTMRNKFFINGRYVDVDLHARLHSV